MQPACGQDSQEEGANHGSHVAGDNSRILGVLAARPRLGKHLHDCQLKSFCRNPKQSQAEFAGLTGQNPKGGKDEWGASKLEKYNIKIVLMYSQDGRCKEVVREPCWLQGRRKLQTHGL